MAFEPEYSDILNGLERPCYILEANQNIAFDLTYVTHENKFNIRPCGKIFCALQMMQELEREHEVF